MTSKIASPPLHWRNESPEARAAVRRRYQVFQAKLGPQVTILQESNEFRARCAELYERGYKDWMILGAVFNRLLQTKLIGQGIAILDGQKAAKVAFDITNDSAPIHEVCDAEHFCGREFTLFLQHFNFLALASYGFELRQRNFQPETVERFLRERLNYFEMDLPHKALFGDKPGSWPKHRPRHCH